MDKNPPKKRKLLKALIASLFTINDTPQRIALGLGIGVFAGILPGTGPVAALVLASFARANRAAGLIGSVATNTWLSFVTFVAAAKIGAMVFGLNWLEVYGQWLKLIKDFHWASLLQTSFLELVLPLFTGYLIVGLGLGIVVYLVSMAAFKIIPKKVWQRREK